jgi:hypothetical protein
MSVYVYVCVIIICFHLLETEPGDHRYVSVRFENNEITSLEITSLEINVGYLC